MSHRFTRENSTISSGRSPCRSWPRGLVSPTPTWPTRAGRRSSSAHSRSEDLEGRARHPTPPTVEGIGLLFLLPFCSHNTPKQGGTRRRTTHHQTTWNRLLPNAFPARSEGYRSWPCCTHNPYLKALRGQAEGLLRRYRALILLRVSLPPSGATIPRGALSQPLVSRNL